MKWVRGLPCRSSSGGPDPPWRRLMRAPAPSTCFSVNPSNTEELREFVHILKRVDVPEHVEHRGSPVLRHLSPLRALPEFLRQLVIRHRVRGAPLAEIGLA